MPNAKSFLAVDFGAATLKAAEFEPTPTGELRLKAYGFKPLGSEGVRDSGRAEQVRQALKELLAEMGAKSKDAHASMPSFQVISKLVKLPPVDNTKISQIIKYEAQQNLPFPLEEMAWDFQILGTTPSDEVEVWILGTRLEDATQVAQCAKAAGLNLLHLDASCAALANVFRYNYADLPGCSLVLDIGARSSTLLFFEGNRTLSRAINIGASNITQDFSKESKLDPAEAERLKIAEGFVSLGGIYQEPQDEQRTIVSKVARQVMARIHVQVNQTIQIYRVQQGGTAPQRLFLAGGGSSLPYTAEFFAEKLGLPVEYFNPLPHVELDPALDAEAVGKQAHMMGELVGLALRNVAHCPVEFNLMPKPLLKQQELKARTPFFSATVAYLVLVVVAMGWFCAAITDIRRKTAVDFEELLAHDTQLQDEFKARIGAVQTHQQTLDELKDLLEARNFWAGVLQELQNEITAVEAEMKTQLNISPAVWIESFHPNLPSASPAGAPPAAPPRITTVQVRFGAKDLATPTTPEANDRLVFRLLERLRLNPVFASKTAPSVGTKPINSLFYFTADLELKAPIKARP